MSAEKTCPACLQPINGYVEDDPQGFTVLVTPCGCRAARSDIEPQFAWARRGQ